MQKLLISRKVKDQPQETIQNLQPEKYGKGAYCDLSYTPSKLADHILFKDANFLKRLEEQASKNRALQAKNKTLNDQIDYLKRERDGIEGSLKKMIDMYKGIMSEMEAKSDERANYYQQKFKGQLEKVLKDKAEEARYIQSEKEILQERITELEQEVDKQKQEIRLLNRSKSQVHKALDELTIEHKHLNQKYDSLKERFEQKCQQAKQEYDSLKKQFINAQVEWKNTLNQQIHKKDLQIEKNERIHRTQLEKVEGQRQHELSLKNQEITDLTKAFQSESNKMKEIIGVKDKMIDTLTVENHKQKARVLALTRDYQSQISHLSHEKNRLLDQIDLYAHDNENLIKDKALITEDLQKENLNLRDLLFQSSVQLEKCKSQLVSLARDNTKLLTRVKSSEQEAKTWRDSYYISKNRPT